jgi:hypothetical protein
MQEFKCLYLEDDDDDYQTFTQIIERALRPTRVDFVRAITPEHANELLDQIGNQLHIFFADLLIRDPSDGAEIKETDRGLYVVEEAAKYPNIVIFALSKAEGSHPGTSDQFYKRAGSDSWYFDKRKLKDSRQYTSDKIRSEIETAISKKGYSLGSDGEVKLDWQPGIPGNESLDAEVDSIGTSVLRELLRKIASDCIKFTPQYLAPGFSGASVLRIIGTRTPPKASKGLLVKFSPNRNKLRQELDAAPKDGESSSDIYVPYLREGAPWEYDGYFAIAARFEEGALTLQNWLVDTKPSSRSVREFFRELFFEGLAKAYSEGRRVDDKALWDTVALTDRTRARILIGLDLIDKLLLGSASPMDLTLVRDFIRFNGQIGSHPATALPRVTHTCICHGDLHSRNILVKGAKSRPSLIDTARRQERHWASDVARLSSDLWISNWDSVPGSYYWENLGTWRESVGRWLSGQAVDPIQAAPNKPTYDALVWIRNRLRKLFEELCGSDYKLWQFHLALAIEFLEMSSYPDVPMPKRCLGVLVANDILTSLENEISWL